MSVAYNLSASSTNGGFVQNFQASNVTAVQSSAGMLAVTLNLGTATSAISTASASSLGFCYARNLSTATSAVQTVSFGKLDGTSLHDTVTLRQGEVAWLRLSPGNYAAKANTTDVTLLLQILED